MSALTTASGAPLLCTSPPPIAISRSQYLTRKIQVVKHGQHRQAALAVQRPDQVHDLELKCNVQVGSGLVEKQHVRLLGQRPGDHHPLPLTAGERVYGAVLRWSVPVLRKRLQRDLGVVSRLHSKSAEPRRPAHKRDLHYGELESHHRILRHHRDPPGKLARANLVNIRTSRRTQPFIGASTLDSDLSSVVFPLPLGPIIPRNSPGARSTDTPLIMQSPL